MSRTDRFVSQPGEMTISQCAHCARKHAGSGTCDAFPAGIPMPILLNQADHREPYPGDGGLQFKAKPGDRWSTSLKS